MIAFTDPFAPRAVRLERESNRCAPGARALPGAPHNRRGTVSLTSPQQYRTTMLVAGPKC